MWVCEDHIGGIMAQGTVTEAQQLAAQVDAVNDAIVDVVASATPEQWRRVTGSEEWPAGVVAHHVAEVQRFLAGVIDSLSRDEATPVTLRSADVEANNARHAAEFTEVGKAETLDALRENGAALAERIRGLDDDQLARVAFVFDGQELTAEQVVAFAAIGHFQEHLKSLRQTLAA
jgi:uncharacterized damage-inducible protein DinB